MYIHVVCAISIAPPSLQHGRRIETMVALIDFENLSIQRHYYWPGIEALKAVRGPFVLASCCCFYQSA